MSSLAEFIPIELVNHILSFRPRHPDACIIKKYKERIIEFEEEHFKQMTFQEINEKSTYHTLFSRYIIPNCIYKIKTQFYKNSNVFYWGRYYTEKTAFNDFVNYIFDINEGEIYEIRIVSINNDSLEEHTVDCYCNPHTNPNYQEEREDENESEEWFEEEFEDSEEEKEEYFEEDFDF